jgi:hypothetical protein
VDIWRSPSIQAGDLLDRTIGWWAVGVLGDRLALIVKVATVVPYRQHHDRGDLDADVGRN